MGMQKPKPLQNNLKKNPVSGQRHCCSNLDENLPFLDSNCSLRWITQKTIISAFYNNNSFYALAREKLIWLICALHTNQLPIRHLIIRMDGKQFQTISSIKDKMPNTDVDINFVNLVIVKNLSADQEYLYEITQAIQSGIFPANMTERKVGLNNHAR